MGPSHGDYWRWAGAAIRTEPVVGPRYKSAVDSSIHDVFFSYSGITPAFSMFQTRLTRVIYDLHFRFRFCMSPINMAVFVVARVLSNEITLWWAVEMVGVKLN
jgi:hypothetical protein